MYIFVKMDQPVEQAKKCEPVENAIISGHPILKDGDTFVVNGCEIRLQSIDTPEKKQSCCLDGKSWDCAGEGVIALTKKINSRIVSCRLTGKKTRSGALPAYCSVKDESETLNRWLVKKGWALAYRTYSLQYIAVEREAQDGKRGMWQGQFMPPWTFKQQSHWKKANRKPCWYDPCKC